MRTLKQQKTYILKVLKKQNKKLEIKQMYGDGSLFNFDFENFKIFYPEICEVFFNVETLDRIYKRSFYWIAENKKGKILASGSYRDVRKEVKNLKDKGLLIS
tara:strand:- start:1398 stop:1703 length:306 start_codon:yes stop_codon:yes gene_type:complete